MAQDYTDKYNTKLSPADEAKFQAWIKTLPPRLQSTADYDMRGAWQADAQQAANGHLPDTWKKPNHPTFSDESQYHSAATPGGKWIQIAPPDSAHPEGKWAFQASDWNVRNFGVEGLKQYFQQSEPDATLTLPLAARMYPQDAGPQMSGAGQ